MESSDADLICAATEALQAQERFQLQLRSRRHQTKVNEVYPNACKIMDSLREIKSELEKTAVTFESVHVDKSVLQELRSHVLMHVPGTLTPEVKVKLTDLVTKAFGGSCKKILFAALVTCPWYRATQEERGLQAKHNTVFAVYINKDEQVFSPVNPHLKEKDSEVIDEGWFYATEAFHFANYLLKGKARFVEALYLPESAVFYEDEEWISLKAEIDPQLFLGLRGFLEQCRGQAVGSVGKKSKSTGRMKLKDGATLYEFCESFRLLFNASLSLTEHKLHLGSIEETNTLLSDNAHQAFTALKTAYQADMCDKVSLFGILMNWKSEVDKQMSGRKFIAPDILESKIGKWLVRVRTQSKLVPHQLSVRECHKSNLLSLMEKIGGPVVKMKPENIIMIARAGSYLYGLNTPESDVDYLIIYADPIEKVLSSCKRPSESVESRGPEKLFEYGAYEVRLFCEMLWKGSVVMLELLFTDELDYTSEVWNMLVSNKHVFLTERAILQYFGLIKNNMSDIEHKRYTGTKRENKLFYQIMHKLNCLQYFLRGECPQVKCEGPVRDNILKIREGPLEGEIHRDKLYAECKDHIDSLRKKLSERTKRLPENASYNFLLHWLMTVRGWKATDELQAR